MKRYIETSCNGMVEADDGPWVSYEDAWNKRKLATGRNEYFTGEAINCLNALGDAWRNDWSVFDGSTLENQLSSIIMVLNHERTFDDFLELEDIKKDEAGNYEWD